MTYRSSKVTWSCSGDESFEQTLPGPADSMESVDMLLVPKDVLWRKKLRHSDYDFLNSWVPL